MEKAYVLLIRGLYVYFVLLYFFTFVYLNINLIINMKILIIIIKFGLFQVESKVIK